MAHLKGLRCYGCGDTGFDDGDDGFFYCLTCGFQSQDVFDTAVQVDPTLFNSLYGKSVLQSQSANAIKTEDGDRTVNPITPKEEPKPFSFEDDISVPADFGNSKKQHLDAKTLANSIRLRYVQGLQLMIQMQCEALVEKFEVSPLICGLAGTIWLRFIAASRVLADGWANDAIIDSEIEYQNREIFKEEGEQDYKHDGRKNEPHNLYGQRAIAIWFKSLKRKISLESSLAISFLACHMAREAVLPTDMVKWTLEGTLPYIAAFVDIERYIGSPSSTCPISFRSMFRPPRTIKTWQLESLAGVVAQHIGLQLPPVNFYLIASRFLRQLLLPVQKILPDASYIYEWLMPPDLWLSAISYKLPTRACVMSILMVAIRILYNIHGSGIWEKSTYADTRTEKSSSGCCMGSSDFDARELLCHLEKLYEKLGDAHEYSKDLSAYLNYCKDVVFAGLKTSFEEESVVDQLWKFYENEEDIKPPMGEKGHGGLTRKRLRENVPVGLLSDHKMADNGTQKQVKTEPYDSSFDNLEHNRDSSMKCSLTVECSASSRENPLSPEEALRRMTSNMEENNFHYVPPRRVSPSKNRYLYYKRKKAGAKFNYQAHADYYILLRACAKVVEIDVRVMHVSVLKLEKRLSLVEEWINMRLKLLKDRSCKNNDLGSMDVEGDGVGEPIDVEGDDSDDEPDPMDLEGDDDTLLTFRF